MGKKMNRMTSFDAVIIVILSIVILVTLYPMYYVAISSVSNPTRLISHQGPLFYPLGIDFSSYKLVFDNPMISRGYINTILYVIVGTTVNVTMTILGAFVLSRKGLYWGKLLRLMVVFTLFFSSGLIPFYLVVDKVGLMGNWLAVIVPYAINPMNLIIMRTSFMTIPQSLEEAARLDGAKEIYVLFRIIVPLSMPIIAVMILFYGVGHWSSWFSAMIFIKKREMFPLQLILREILITNSTESMMTSVGGSDKAPLTETIKYATIIVATVPILLVYPFLQKYFIKGVMVGAIKE